MSRGVRAARAAGPVLGVWIAFRSLAVAAQSVQPAAQHAPASAPPTLAALTAQWRAGQYDAVAPALVDLWPTVRPAERLGVDLMIVSSLCRSARPARRATGRQWLAYVQTQYRASLPTALAPVLQAEGAECQRPSTRAVPAATAVLIVQARPARASMELNGAKTWSMVCGAPGQAPIQDASPARRVSASAGTPLLSGVAIGAPGADTLALAAVRGAFRRAAPAVAGSVALARAAHVALGSVSGHTAAAAARLTTALEDHVLAMQGTFGMAPPDSVVLAFVVQDPMSLGSFLTHDLGVQSMSDVFGHGLIKVIGGSVDAVPAVAAVLQPTTTEPGTLAHEVTHLLIHRDFPEAPGWLDEGLASLTESEDVRDGQIAPRGNWRGRVLIEEPPTRSRRSRRRTTGEGGDPPAATRVRHVPLAELFRVGGYTATDAAESWVAGADMSNVARGPEAAARQLRDADQTYATARYFLLFLHRRGVLPRVYAALRDWRPITGGDTPTVHPLDADATLRVVGDALGVAPGAVEPAFEAWLEQELQQLPPLRC